MRYRAHLPQLEGDLFLTDGGMETVLSFQEGFDLPCFASFVLLEDPAGIQALRTYYDGYLRIAARRRDDSDAPTWRANRDWGAQLGYSDERLDEINRRAVALVDEIRAAHQTNGEAIVINGVVGPRGDGYRASDLMTPAEAESYHAAQITTFSETAADMASALTMTYAEEAIGIARAARAVDMPVVLSFTVETDGRLPSGQRLRDAIVQVDEETDGMPAYFMINCAHPTHFAHVLEEGAPWVDRIRGLRANASRKSHAELDESEELDDGDPVELGAEYRALRNRLRKANVVGGCCGTDHRHVAEICRALSS